MRAWNLAERDKKKTKKLGTWVIRRVPTYRMHPNAKEDRSTKLHWYDAFFSSTILVDIRNPVEVGLGWVGVGSGHERGLSRLVGV